MLSFKIDTKDEESDNEENSQDDEDDPIIKPKRNAFEILDDDDED